MMENSDGDRPSYPTPEARAQYGRDWYRYVTTKSPMPAETPYTNVGIQNFVMGEVWSRPGLDVRTRRWITLACVAASDTVVPIQSHIYSALNSGDMTVEELHEFTLQFAVYCGWAKASIVNQTIIDTWERILKEGGPVKMVKPDPIA